MTDPYLPETINLVRQSHHQTKTITLSVGADSWTVRPLAGSIEYAEDRSPGAILSATLPNVFSAEDLAKLDPRNRAVTVTVQAGYIWPDNTEDVHTIFTGQLDARVARTPSALVDIDASTSETLTQESAWMSDETFVNYAGVREAITAWITYALGTAPGMVSSIGNLYRPDLVTGVQLTTGTDMWTLIDQVANMADLRVFVDDSGLWHIDPKPRVAGTTSAFLSTGNGGIVKETTDSLSRSGYYNAAVLVYEWQDPSGNPKKVIGKFGSPAGRTYVANLTIPVTKAMADAAAQGRVRNLSTRGNGYTLRGVPCWWLRPGHTVEITLANGTTARQIVREVSFDFSSGDMNVTTREPSNVG